jgi:hypothetical protein
MSRAKALYCMAGCKIVDFLTAGLPAVGMALLFLIIPAYLTMASIQLMEWPSKDVWSGFRFPDVVEALHNTNEYPSTIDTNDDGDIDDEERENAKDNRLLMWGNDGYPTVDAMQSKFDRAAGKDGKNTDNILERISKQYDGWVKEDGNEEKDQDDFAEEVNKRAGEDVLESDGESWIITEKEWTYSEDGISYTDFENENNIWASSSKEGSEVYFDGESHSRLKLKQLAKSLVCCETLHQNILLTPLLMMMPICCFRFQNLYMICRPQSMSILSLL